MAKAVSLAALLFAGIVAAKALVACSPFGGASAFTCDSDDDCAGALDGRCEPNGFCSFADETNCGPGGRAYGQLSGNLAGTCVGAEPPPEAAPDTPDAPLSEPGETCLGTGFEVPCFATPPTGDVMLTVAIDTDNPATCATVSNTTACVIAGASITVPLGTTVAVTGSRRLVLAATGAIAIDGVLDAASDSQPLKLGPAANDVTCDGGTLPNNGGGGGGGSFGAKGGNGGTPNSGTSGLAPATVTTLRGGCRAQDGKEGVGNATTHGIGGNGGGAVFLIAGTTITVAATGRIDASGAFGDGGNSGDAGAGGGGSGGMIGLDAPTVLNQGLILANGAGGGEGSGNNPPGGNNGTEPVTVAPATGGAGGSGTGGDGGVGGAGGAAGNGNNSAGGGGGAGGGGVGIIRVFPAQAIGGNVSPPAT